MAKVTLRNVAEASGYSVATVSRVLTGSRPVGPEIARHVRHVGEALGYRPDRVARALRSGSTGTIGMLVPQITNPFFPSLVHDVERAFNDCGRALLFSDSNDDPKLETVRINMLLDRKVDGLMVIPCHAQDSRSAVLAAADEVPVVQIDRRVDDAQVDFVGLDNRAGVESIVAHLWSTGRTRFAFVGTEQAGSSTQERLDSYLRTAVKILPGNADRVHLGGLSVEWGHEAATRMLSEDKLPEAVVCANDLVAMGVVQALRRRGVLIPEEVAVSGFDDTVFASVCDPSLTTCRQPTREIAAEGVRLMEARIEDGADRLAVNVRFAPELVVRASTLGAGKGPAASANVSRQSATTGCCDD